MDKKRAERLLETAKEMQTAYWKAIGELEEETSLDVDSTADLQGQTIESLFDSANTELEEDDDQEIPVCEACGCTDGTCQHAA